MKYWLAVGICMGSTLVGSSEVTVRLQYLPHVPVVQTSRLQIEMNDAFPGFKIKGKAFQTIESVITLAGDQSELPILQPPLDLTYVLKKIHVELSANNVKKGFSSSYSPTSLPLVQGTALIDRPLKLRLDTKFSLEKENSSLKKLLDEIPILHDLRLESFFLEWFQHLFALSGKDLALGHSYKVVVQGENYPYTFQYTITSLTDDNIQADIQGLIESKGIKLKGQFPMDGMKNSDAELSVTAKVQGNASWNLHNALVFRLDTHSAYTGVLKIADSTWNLGMNLDHHLNSASYLEQ